MGKDFTNSMKYFGIKIDENLNWKQQISHIEIKQGKCYLI